jgi:hypothetical protein
MMGFSAFRDCLALTGADLLAAAHEAHYYSGGKGSDSSK